MECNGCGMAITQGGIEPEHYRPHRCIHVGGRVMECVCGEIVTVTPSGERYDWPENAPHAPHVREGAGAGTTAPMPVRTAPRVLPSPAPSGRRQARGIEI